MGSVGDRIRRLEARMGPLPSGTSEMSPILSLVLKDMDRQRREMDGLPPDPANEVLTPEEEQADRQATREFLPYLEAERERARDNPATLEDIEWAIAETKAEIAKLDQEEAS